MKALLFIQMIKGLLRDVESSGGNTIFRVNSNHELVNTMKSHALRRLKDQSALDTYELRQFIDDLLSRDIFRTRIRYCVVKLQEFAIEEAKYPQYVAKAIDLHIERKGQLTHTTAKSTPNIEELLILELAKCFQSWYRPEDLFIYDFSQERQLILPNKNNKNWLTSNLGRYFLGLTSFEAISFLCALEVVITLEFHQNSFISLDTVRHLLASRNDNQPLSHSLLSPYSLRMFGIIRGYFTEDRQVTDFGYQILSNVDRNFHKLKSIILILLESESTGFNYESETNFDKFVQTMEESNILVIDQKNSIKKAIELYRTDHRLDALRILFPLIEGTLDSAFDKFGISLSGLTGMRNKSEKLVREGVITNDLSITGEIISSSRNKIVHGNIREEDNEFFQPLFVLSVAYFQRLLIQLRDGHQDAC